MDTTAIRFVALAVVLVAAACGTRTTPGPGTKEPIRQRGYCAVPTDRETSAAAISGSSADTQIRGFALELAEGEKTYLTLTISYVTEAGGLEKQTRPLLEGDWFPDSRAFAVESIGTRLETWGDPRSGVAAAVLVREAVVRHSESGQRYSLRSDGQRCLFAVAASRP